MKKRLTTFFMFAALLFAPFALVGCGEDIQVPDNPNNEGIENPIDGAATLFTGSKTALDGDGTRTSMDANRKFYWEAGDYIWVDTLKNGTFTGKSHSIELSNPTQAPSATFYYRQIILTERNYNLTYTGNNSNKGTEVTIAAVQEQSEKNNAAHLGKSGDCGIAIAERDDATGKYNFVLKHQASYLVFQPYRATAITDAWKLVKIEVVDENGNPVCGTYEFGMSGINTTNNIMNGKDTLSLICGDGNAELPRGASSADFSWFAVIQPGKHDLRIRYHIKPTGSVNAVAGTTGDVFIAMMDIDERNYRVNGVTTIKHELSAVSYSTDLIYMWDAPVGEYYWKYERNPPTVIGGYADGWPRDANDSRWYNTVFDGGVTQASRSCKDLPNVNALAWYVKEGDPRWEDAMPWCLNGDYANVYSCGAWLMKWEHIQGKPTGSTITNCAISPTSFYGEAPTDYRTTQMSSTPTNANPFSAAFLNTSDSYKSGGRPSVSEIGKYFFLPAIHHAHNGYYGGEDHRHVLYGLYWSSSPMPTVVTPYYYEYHSYSLSFGSHFMNIDCYDAGRTLGRVVAPSGWFQ